MITRLGYRFATLTAFGWTLTYAPDARGKQARHATLADYCDNAASVDWLSKRPGDALDTLLPGEWLV